jgi:DnaJ-class molecular chaperone
MDYYKILNVNENASQEEIKKSYRKLQLNYHPDKNNNTNESIEMTQKINEAYDILGDEEKRKQYHMNHMNHMNLNNDIFDNPIFEDLFNNPFGPFGAFGGGLFNNVNKNMSMQMPNNIKIFHNGLPVHIHEQMNKPTPIIKNITINMIQVLEGCIIPCEIERWNIENDIKIHEKELLYINIPKSIDNGEIIILKEKGNKINEFLKGDIKFIIEVKNETKFTRNGLDLIYNKSLTLKEALCGFSFDLEHINKKIYTLNNNSGIIIYPKYQKVIPNLGLQRDNYKGNLIIIFDVEFPTILNNDQIMKLKEIF